MTFGGMESVYFYLDLETTGLDPSTDLIIEFAAAVCDDELEILDERLYIFPMSSFIERKLEAADSVVKDMHTENHLLAEMTKLQALGNNFSYNYYKGCLEADVLNWLGYFGMLPGTLELAGSGVHFDRAMLKAHMPLLESFMHYRNFDVSTMKRMAKRWAPEYYRRNPIFEAVSSHRAQSDMRIAVEHTRLVRSIFSLSEQIWPGQTVAD